MNSEPREFGPYRLVRRLGVGGMAETFEATRVGAGGFEQRVCLKRVLPAFGEDEELMRRFQREAKLAAQLRHTNIVGVIDAGEIDGAQYMALELVDGVDLRSFLKSSPDERLSEQTVVLLGTDLALALEHAHGTLVHRDISPSNILLSRAGVVKLADFGIAKAIEAGDVTESRSARGKIPYMAPEHMRGERIDGRADLFSLGVVMFEALAGARPFDGAHDVETMQKVLEGDARSLADIAPWVSPGVRGIVERLLAVDTERRTTSASVLVEELADVAPPQSVRRELAATIEGFRGGPKARLHVRAKEEERDTELSRRPGPREELTGARAEPRGRRALLLFAAAVLVGAIAVIGGTRSNDRLPTEAVTARSESEQLQEAAPVGRASEQRQESAPESASESASSASEQRQRTASASSVSASEPRQRDAPASAPASKGWVNVVVEPWGNVWIDGDYMGRAPVEARLGKGRHVIEAGRELPSQKRVVRVQPGARKEVEIRLIGD